jgi:hypothetical protein
VRSSQNHEHGIFYLLLHLAHILGANTYSNNWINLKPIFPLLLFPQPIFLYELAIVAWLLLTSNVQSSFFSFPFSDLPFGLVVNF